MVTLCTVLPDNTAVAAHPDPALPEVFVIVTVGALEYPEPPLVTDILAIVKLGIAATLAKTV